MGKGTTMNQSRLSWPCVLFALIMIFFLPPTISVAASIDSQRRALLPETHRSSSGVHKLLVFDDDDSALERLVSAGTVLRTIDYGGFRLLLVDEEAMGILGEPVLQRVRVRDDFDLVALNGWTIDTRIGEPSDLPTNRVQAGALFDWQLYVVQFVGPPREEWIAALTSAGDVERVGYLPNNAYLVRASRSAWARLDQEAGRPGGAIQWAGVYHPAYRISQRLEPAIADGVAEVDVVVQLLENAEGRAAVEQLRQQAVAIYGEDEVLAGWRNVRVRVAASLVPALANEPLVLWIEPLVPMHPANERQGQIVAGDTHKRKRCKLDINVVCKKDADCVAGECAFGEGPSSPGYWSWLGQKGLTCDANPSHCTSQGTFDFVVDVTDTGFDEGTVTDVPPDFIKGAFRRVRYAVDYTRLELGAQDNMGHGTAVAATVGGFNINADDASQDEDFYQYGLGIAPEVILGSSKVLPGGVEGPLSTVIANAYNAGARISNNSWNRNVNDYDSSAQTYDMLVRDADSGTPGNQEMTIVFSAANAGGGAGTVRTPATAKNVISVGASDGYWNPTNRPAEWCNGDLNANDARDITSFSSRGPTDDGRTKPDIVAPATRTTGAASGKACDPVNGPFDPTCSPFVLCTAIDAPICCDHCQPPICGFIRDPDETHGTYLAASGTSFAAPAVSGAAALLRQHFLNNGWGEASPAMTKAYLLATTTYLTGEGANDTLPSNAQGYGRVNLRMAFDETPSQRLDQSQLFTEPGQVYTLNGTIANPSEPFRVVLAWTDAPGTTTGNAWVNDLNLEVLFFDVEGDYLLYHGNHFSGANSVCVEVLGVPPPSPSLPRIRAIDRR